MLRRGLCTSEVRRTAQARSGEGDKDANDWMQDMRFLPYTKFHFVAKYVEKHIPLKPNNTTKTLDIPTFSMTDIINKIRTTDENAAKKFAQKKEEVNELAKRIYKLEKINLELTKHGIYLTNKTIESMLKGANSVNKEYNNKGQNITNDQLKMSSIVEEA